MGIDSFYISALRIKRSTDHTRKQPVKNPEQKGWIGWIYVGWMIWHIAIIAWEEEKLILSRTANRFRLRLSLEHHTAAAALSTERKKTDKTCGLAVNTWLCRRDNYVLFELVYMK